MILLGQLDHGWFVALGGSYDLSLADCNVASLVPLTSSPWYHNIIGVGILVNSVEQGRHKRHSITVNPIDSILILDSQRQVLGQEFFQVHDLALIDSPLAEPVSVFRNVVVNTFDACCCDKGLIQCIIAHGNGQQIIPDPDQIIVIIGGVWLISYSSTDEQSIPSSRWSSTIESQFREESFPYSLWRNFIISVFGSFDYEFLRIGLLKCHQLVSGPQEWTVDIKLQVEFFDQRHEILIQPVHVIVLNF